MDRLFLPLGLLYVGDALEKAGKQVEIFHEHSSPEVIDALVEKVKRDKPEWVGFTVMTGPNLTAVIEASKRIKNEAVASKVYWGGMHPTMVNVKEPYVDEAIRGEGEAWVTGKPVQDMDDFQPAWHLIDASRYGDILHLVTSRGCPHRCGFCYSPQVWGRRWKAHSVAKVREIIESYPIKPRAIEFRDDYFFTLRLRALQIIKLTKSWSATIRAPDLTQQLVDQLPVPPEELSMGVESGSQRLLDLITKDITLKDVEVALAVAEKNHIRLYLTFIIGLPTETPEETESTVSLKERIQEDYKNVRCSVKRFRAYPGTALYDLAVKNGFSPPTNSEEWAKYALEVWK